MLGGRRGNYPFCPRPWGAVGARVASHTKLFPSILSSEGAFYGIVDSVV